ncbi:glycosyltransferase [Marinactinospora thermotolerans]|uniref:glycosyltransferase n=1 Tax=Marinactinospora thermotolerans TaxID=531310 RepID=UPI003D8F46CA
MTALPPSPQTSPGRPAGPALRILIGTDTYPPDVNGAAYFTHRLAVGLAERGHDVHVVCASADGPPHVERAEGVTLHRLRSSRVVPHSPMRVAVPLGVDGHLSRLITRLAPHAVHSQSHFTISRAVIRRARAAGVPVVLTNHFMPENLFAHAHIPPRLQAVSARLAWRDMMRVGLQADHVTTPTERAARLLREQGFARPVEVLSCGIDLERFRPRGQERAAARVRLGLPERDTIVFVGRLDEEKRIDELIRALREVLRHRDVQLALVGTGQREKELRALAQEIGVAGRVHFLGFVPDEELPLAYVAADLFAIGGIAELQSIATLEAMSTGLPVVAADAMALPHLVRPGRNGHLYPPGDVATLARHLLDVLESPSRRAEMGAASREIVLQHDQRRSLDRFEELYARIRPRRSGTSPHGAAPLTRVPRRRDNGMAA